MIRDWCHMRRGRSVRRAHQWGHYKTKLALKNKHRINSVRLPHCSHSWWPSLVCVCICCLTSLKQIRAQRSEKYKRLQHVNLNFRTYNVCWLTEFWTIVNSEVQKSWTTLGPHTFGPRYSFNNIYILRKTYSIFLIDFLNFFVFYFINQFRPPSTLLRVWCSLIYSTVCCL